MKKEHIVIAVPSLGGRVPLALAGWVAQLAAANADRYSPYAFSFLGVGYKQPFEYARNLAVTEFLQTDGDRLWFVDDDMIPRPASVGLLQVDGDVVVGGYCRAATDENSETIKLSLLLFEDNPDPYPAPQFRTLKMSGEREPFDIAAGGTGCMIIARHVLEDPRMLVPTEYMNVRGVLENHMDHRGDPGWALPVFKTWRKPDGNTDRGEDLDFCARARAAGYTVRGHMLYGMDHQKTTTTDLLGRSFLRERAIGAASQEVAP